MFQVINDNAQQAVAFVGQARTCPRQASVLDYKLFRAEWFGCKCEAEVGAQQYTEMQLCSNLRQRWQIPGPAENGPTNY